jgi:hypothetical protein
MLSNAHRAQTSAAEHSAELDAETRCVLRILNGSGDTSVSWDAEHLASGDAEAEAAVREAERLFAAARAAGAVAFRVTPGEPATRIHEFDPTAREVLVIPAMVGG